MLLFVSQCALTSTQETVEKMLQATIPAEHQKLGRQVKNYNGERWNQSMC